MRKIEPMLIAVLLSGLAACSGDNFDIEADKTLNFERTLVEIVRDDGPLSTPRTLEDKRFTFSQDKSAFREIFPAN